MSYPSTLDDGVSLPNGRTDNGPGSPASDNNLQANALISLERRLGSDTMPDPRAAADRLKALETVAPPTVWFGFNLLSNNTEGWTGTNSATLVRDATVFRQGVASLKVTQGATPGGATVTVTGSGTVAARFWVIGDATSAGKFVQGSVADPVGSGGQLSVPVMLSATVWKEVLVILPITATTATLSVISFDLTVAMNFWVANVSMKSVVTPVTTASGYRIYKDGQPIRWRGMNHSNTPIGSGPGIPWSFEPKQCRYDLEDISSGGWDCIKLYSDQPYTAQAYGAFLDECYRSGIDVWMFYYVGQNTDYSTATGGANRSGAVTGYQTMVNRVKYHPSIVGYGFGNEMNYNLGPTPVADWYSMLQDACTLVKSTDPTRLRTTSNGDIGEVPTYDAQLSNLDVWGATVYRGRTFAGVEAQYAAATTKPLMVTEYGYDRFNHNALGGAAEDQMGQATRDLQLTRELDAMNCVCGRFLFEWADEWWKESLTGDSWSTHDHVGYQNYNDDRDYFFDEEWFGITTAVGPGNSSSRPKMPAYTMLQAYHQQTPKGKDFLTAADVAALVVSKPGGFAMQDSFANKYWITVGVTNGLPTLKVNASFILSPESHTVPILHFDAVNVVTASAPLVDTWNDSSGYNHNAVQYSVPNRPTLIASAVNGKPAVRFDGNGHFMDVLNFITGGNTTVFIVAANQRASLNGSSIDTLISNVPSGGAAGGIALSTFNGYGSTIQRLFSADFTGGTGTTLWVNGSSVSTNLTLGAFAVMTFQASGISARNQLRLAMYADGALVGDNDIAEIIIYQAILTTAERQAVEASLKTKYATP